MTNMTIAQLKQVANQKGINVPSKISKAVLVELLNGAKTQAQVGNSFRGEY